LYSAGVRGWRIKGTGPVLMGTCNTTGLVAWRTMCRISVRRKGVQVRPVAVEIWC
jgi:hypothetical protein